MSSSGEYPASQSVSNVLGYLDSLVTIQDTNPETEHRLSSALEAFAQSEMAQNISKLMDASQNEQKSSVGDIPQSVTKAPDIIETIIGCDIPFYRTKHINFILKLQHSEESYEYCQTEHLRMQVLYWALCALDLLSELHQINGSARADIIQFVMDCYDAESGGFGGNVNHDPHLLNTLAAIQILVLFDVYPTALQQSKIEVSSIVKYVTSLQQSNGAFVGDSWGEVDTRFTYAAVNALGLLNRLDAIDTEKCVSFLVKCRNFDGGFGTKPNAESHAGMVFCSVGALAILNRLSEVDIDVLNWWLCERQVDTKINNGGLNGRPEKLPDVCYSWWVLSAMSICQRLEWIDQKLLVKFILSCQDSEDGGISDRPDDLPDVYHTYFGIGGLSLLNRGDFKKIDPMWALPAPSVAKLGLPSAASRL